MTHEEIVDLPWSDEIQPLLLKRYSSLTADQLGEAHAYAYSGAVIQDLGYYPFWQSRIPQPLRTSKKKGSRDVLQ